MSRSAIEKRQNERFWNAVEYFKNQEYLPNPAEDFLKKISREAEFYQDITETPTSDDLETSSTPSLNAAENTPAPSPIKNQNSVNFGGSNSAFKPFKTGRII
jgi:hypothetical protein